MNSNEVPKGQLCLEEYLGYATVDFSSPVASLPAPPPMCLELAATMAI